jgi:hypothetical protein
LKHKVRGNGGGGGGVGFPKGGGGSGGGVESLFRGASGPRGLRGAGGNGSGAVAATVAALAVRVLPSILSKMGGGESLFNTVRRFPFFRTHSRAYIITFRRFINCHSRTPFRFLNDVF